jgi:hypothetical protein
LGLPTFLSNFDFLAGSLSLVRTICPAHLSLTHLIHFTVSGSTYSWYGKGKAVPLHTMEALGGERRYSSYSFSTSALDGGEWSASRPGRAFIPGERIPGTHCTGGWVSPRAGLHTEARGKILCPRRGSNPDRPVVQPVFRHYTA